MDSSEYSSSEHSSISSDSTFVESQSATMVNTSMMSFAPPMSQHEMKMIGESKTSLMNTFDQYRPQLTKNQYAYFCKYSRDYLILELEKKARKTHRLGNTTFSMADSASVVGSSSSVPLYQLYPSNFNMPLSSRYARAPSVAPSTSREYPGMQAFDHTSQHYMMSGHSSGYSSGVPSNGVDSLNRTGFTNSAYPYNPHRRLDRQQPHVAKSQNDTLLQAIYESEAVSSSPEPQQRQPHNIPRADPRDRPARPTVPTPPTSPSPVDSDNNDANVKEKKVSNGVPKQRSSVTKLINWCIKLLGEDLCVHGTKRDKSQVTSGAVLKYSHPIIVATNGQFQVIGDSCFGERTPAYVREICLKGFPRQWKALSKRWLTDRQARRKSTPKKSQERKSPKNNSSSAIRIKVNNSASKSTSNASSKAKTSKSAPAKKSETKPQKKNERSPGSQSDKENKTTRRRSKSMETSKKYGEASSPDTEREQSQNKRRSKSMVTSKNQKEPLAMEDEDELDSDSSVSVKQTKTKVVKSRSNPGVAHKNKRQKHMSSDDENESDSDSPTATKQTKSKVVKSRSTNPCVTSNKMKKPDPKDDESESEYDETVIESTKNPAKRAVQDRGSDTSWDLSVKKYGSPSPRAQPKKVSTNNKGTDRIPETKPNNKKTASDKTKGTNRIPEPEPNTKRAAPDKPKDLGKAVKTNVKAKQVSSSNKARSIPTKSNGGSKKAADIFGDKPMKSDHATDAFSAMGGDDLFSGPCSRSMTPNTLVASIQPDAGTIGRYTPPLQALVDFFPGNRSAKANSSFGSPSSLLNNSRDNPVSKRMAKDVVEASKKGGKKKRKLPEPEVPGELEELVKSLKSTNTVKTPTIVKKVFRNQRDSDDESFITDKDESLIY